MSDRRGDTPHLIPLLDNEFALDLTKKTLYVKSFEDQFEEEKKSMKGGKPCSLKECIGKYSMSQMRMDLSRHVNAGRKKMQKRLQDLRRTHFLFRSTRLLQAALRACCCCACSKTAES